MTQKKGELELKYIILLILGVIVLIAIVLIFREHISNFIYQITTVSTELNASRPSVTDIVGTTP